MLTEQQKLAILSLQFIKIITIPKKQMSGGKNSKALICLRKIFTEVFIPVFFCCFLFCCTETVFADVNEQNALTKADEVSGARHIDYCPPARQPGKSRSTLGKRSGAGELPSSYSLKDEGLVTSVKDQSSDGSCWAFAYAAMAESSMIRSMKADQDIDLSEKQLAYFIYNKSTADDPLGNTGGDANLAKDGLDYLKEGGNSYLATMHLSGYCGMTDESVVPYVPYGEPAPSAAYLHNTAVLKNAYFIYGQSVSDMKKALMEHGALNGNFYYKKSFFNEENGAYFSGSEGEHTTDQNHIVCIVGWDDSYPAENFSEAKRPASPGAWLAKNSWGDDDGDNGYIWISYEDTSLCDIVCTEFMPTDTYTHNYHYDGSASMADIPVGSGGSLANVFKVCGNSTGNDEQLKAVSIGVNSTDVRYSIQIYTDLDDPAEPYSGTEALEMPVTGITDYAGIYTVPIEEEVVLSQDSYYAVVVTNMTADEALFFADKTEDYGWLKCVSSTCEKESFYREEQDNTWTDLSGSDSPAAARIKGLTVDLDTKQIPDEIKRSISEAVCGEIQKREYTGRAICPAVILKYGTEILAEGQDYSCEYMNNINPGTARIKIRGLGLFTGEIEVVFRIVEKTAEKEEKQEEPASVIPAQETEQEEPASAVPAKKAEPVSGRLICKKISDRKYTGRRIKPAVSVTLNGKKLNRQFYTLSWKNNRKIGTARVTVTLKNGYKGTVSRTFRIVPARVRSFSIRKKNGGRKVSIKTAKVKGGVTGYIVEYSYSGHKKHIHLGRSGEGTLKLKSGKKYCIRIRAYKKIGNKRFYGRYSKKKYVKVR